MAGREVCQTRSLNHRHAISNRAAERSCNDSDGLGTPASCGDGTNCNDATTGDGLCRGKPLVCLVRIVLFVRSYRCCHGQPGYMCTCASGFGGQNMSNAAASCTACSEVNFAQIQRVRECTACTGLSSAMAFDLECDLGRDFAGEVWALTGNDAVWALGAPPSCKHPLLALAGCFRTSLAHDVCTLFIQARPPTLALKRGAKRKCFRVWGLSPIFTTTIRVLNRALHSASLLTATKQTSSNTVF